MFSFEILRVMRRFLFVLLLCFHHLSVLKFCECRRVSYLDEECIDQVKSPCVEALLNGTETETMSDGVFLLQVLSVCKVKVTPDFHVHWGWNPPGWLTYVNTVVTEEKACVLNEDNTAAETHWFFSGIWFSSGVAVADTTGGTNFEDDGQSQSTYDLSITYFGGAWGNTFQHLGNGVFRQRRPRLNSVTSTIGIPLDAEFPACMLEPTFWEDQLGLTPAKPNGILWIIRIYLDWVVRVFAKIPFQNIVSSEEPICA